MKISSLRYHVKSNKSDFFSLITVSIIFLSIMILNGYINNWETTRSSVQIFINPYSVIEKVIVWLPIFFPLFFIMWMFYATDCKRFVYRFFIYSGLIFLYLVLMLIVSGLQPPLVELLEGKLKINEYVTNSVLIVLAILITTIFNYILSFIEKRPISLIYFLKWLFILGCIHLFVFLWSSFLRIFATGSFVESWRFNGGLVFSFLVYEGLFYMWLHRKIVIHSREMR